MRFAKYFFDFDGTIMDTKGDVWDSIAFACAQLGFELPDWFRANPANLSLAERKIFEAITGSEDLTRYEEFNSLISHHYRKISNFESSFIYPQIESLLFRLNKIGRECVIISSKPLPPLLKILCHYRLERYFKEIFSADNSISGSITKKAILKRLSAANPDTCVYIGDSSGDIDASKANNICSVGVLYGDGDKEKLKNSRPDYLVSTSTELYELIMKWEFEPRPL